MIPNINTPAINILTQTSKTYGFDNINIIIDGLEAVKQSVYLILNVERYRYAIYSWNYGIEFDDLIGKSKSFVYSEIERRIKEALLQDDRIDTVSAFSFDSFKSEINVRFTVNSLYGRFKSEVRVNV